MAKVSQRAHLCAIRGSCNDADRLDAEGRVDEQQPRESSGLNVTKRPRDRPRPSAEEKKEEEEAEEDEELAPDSEAPRAARQVGWAPACCSVIIVPGAGQEGGERALFGLLGSVLVLDYGKLCTYITRRGQKFNNLG